MITLKECEKLAKINSNCSFKKGNYKTKKEKKKIKKFKQKHGFYQPDVWELYYSIAVDILPKICYLRDHHSGWPVILKTGKDSDYGYINKEQDKRYSEQWTKILDDMVNAFYYIVLDENDLLFLADDNYFKSEVKRREEIIEKGLTLFGKYYRCLWD